MELEELDQSHLREAYETLKKSLEDDIKSSNVDSVLYKVNLINEKFKDILSEGDVEELRKMISGMIRQQVPIPDNYEYYLFGFVLFLVVMVFGES